MSGKKLEIEMLNFDDLDVEELERRLELAAGSEITPDNWFWCECDGIDCFGLCIQYSCEAHDPPCGANCVSDCITDGCGGGTYIP